MSNRNIIFAALVSMLVLYCSGPFIQPNPPPAQSPVPRKSVMPAERATEDTLAEADTLDTLAGAAYQKFL